MRTICWLLLLGSLLTATAGPQPLSNKEIALILRSGYSSEAVLAEVSSRHALEPLDPATKKSLVELTPARS